MYKSGNIFLNTNLVFSISDSLTIFRTKSTTKKTKLPLR
ncbi:hypothetical protein LEP1GSC161_2939 [Leptospira santarosai str. CBC1416]|uniref:Uncharacterized protein n=1 Tax=Leptospira santarosai str. CBC1416 TaxID=1193059 RepID=M6W9Z8_9LEPT|nr:hypothetical protein LEP1GSC161_2939 [Leptospira santarosai str. CBC1416]